jgi:hypothetical protein
MFTSGIGSLVDLPNLSVLVRGIDDWNYQAITDYTITEPRLLAAVQARKDHARVSELRSAPWKEGIENDPKGEVARVGVPIVPFPAWLRCTACNELSPAWQQVFGFENDKARRPQDARFYHPECPRKRGGKRPLAVPARFVLACPAGHLDEFPYAQFVHGWSPCAKAVNPRLRMDDRGGNLGANVAIQCVPCGAGRNMRDAQGQSGRVHLPRCRGRHPHLNTFAEHGCERPARLLVVGASNQWFAQTLSTLAIPRPEASELEDLVETHWQALASLPVAMYPYARANVGAFAQLERWTDGEVAAAVERVAVRLDGDGGSPPEDLRTPEWDAFTADPLGTVTEDFALRRVAVPERLRGVYSDVIAAERLREVRALVGFTRLDAPDPDDPELVTPAPLARDEPAWLPASEVRGEGLFVRVPEDALGGWERRVAGSEALRRHREAYAEFRRERYSDRIPGDFDPMWHWPGPRYLALHTLSHLLIRAIALECGYSSASLSERIYSSTEDDERSGILIYTAVPDAEGTLGGLVSLAEPDTLTRLTRQALRGAMHCSSDPLCAERLPRPPEDFLHGAACHICQFVSETTCERGNRFLDRRFVVPIGDPALALYPEL